MFTSLLVMLLSAWPARPVSRHGVMRARRGRRVPPRFGLDDVQDAVEAPERARARTSHEHQWTGEARFSVGDRCEVVRGRWRLTLDPAQRAHAHGTARTMSLDPAYSEVWETQLGELLTLQVAGSRLAVVSADARGWRVLELRAPTRPETVVQLDRAAVARVLDVEPDTVTVELRVQV